MKKCLLWSLVLTLLLSCSKNEDPQPDPINPDPVPTILSRFVTIDTTKVAPNDTLYMSTFDYDGQGRIAKQTHYNYLPSSGQYEFYSSFAFTYNGSDTLANSITENLTAPNFTLRAKHFLSYNMSNKLSNDSSQTAMINFGNYDSTVATKSYEYTANDYTRVTHYYYPTVITDPAVITTIKNDSRGNITSQFRSSQSGFTTSREFDERVNPLYKVLPISSSYVSQGAYPTFIAMPAQEQKNNVIKEYSVNFDASGNISNPILKKEFITIYHENGMPSSIRMRSTPASSNDKYKHVFIYR